MTEEYYEKIMMDKFQQAIRNVIRSYDLIPDHIQKQLLCDVIKECFPEQEATTSNDSKK